LDFQSIVAKVYNIKIDLNSIYHIILMNIEIANDSNTPAMTNDSNTPAITNESNTPMTKTTEYKSGANLVELDKFLENEKNTNSQEPWSKLDKTAKIRKLTAFATKYVKTNELTDEEHSKLLIFFHDCLDRKKLQRVKEVIYDKTIGEIKDIPMLSHSRSTNHFTLKNIDKHVSTLKSLGPKRHSSTIKKLKDEDEDEDSDCEK